MNSKIDEKQIAIFENLTEENAPDFFKSCTWSEDAPLAYPIRVSKVLTDEDEVYNESFLAELRKIVNCADSEGIKFAFFPVCDGNFSTEVLTAAMKHTARRLKKSTSLAGFYFPEAEDFKNEETRQFFTSELLEKHPQYKFYQV